MSNSVGGSSPRRLGVKSRCSEVTMMTKRSNHMPMFTKIEMTNIAGMTAGSSGTRTAAAR